MNFFRRNQLLYILCVLLLVLFLVWIWPRFSITDGIVKSWNQPEIRTGLIFPVLGAAIIAMLTWLGNAIFGGLRKLWGGGFTEAQRQRWDGEKAYLEGLINDFKDQVSPEGPWYVKGYIDLEALQKNEVQQARVIYPHLWRLSRVEEVGIKGDFGARVNLQSLLRDEKKPIMIKGDPGTGKTLALRRFAVDEANKAKNSMSSTARLPVYIPLRKYVGRTKDGDPEPVFDFIQRCLAETPYAATVSDNLNDYLMHGRLLLLFDGLNELPPDEYLRRSQVLEKFVRSSYFKNKAIFTCRTPRYTPEEKFTTVEICDLDNEQIRHFINAYLHSSATEEIYHALTTGDGFMLRICRNPFMLRMLVLGCQESLTTKGTASIPETPSQLFEGYVQGRLTSVSQNGKQIADSLRDIAFVMQKGGQFAGAVDYDFLKVQLPGVPLDDYLQIAHQQALLNYTYDKEKETHDIRFYHQILQEYFAAIALKEDWEAGKHVDQYFSDYRWEDTILVCVGLTKDPEMFIHKIWSPGYNDLERFWLATKAVGINGVWRVSSQYYEAILQEVQKNLDPDDNSGSEGYFGTVRAVNTVKALSYVDDERAAVVLSETLSASDGWVREVCIQALGNSRLEHARELLLLNVTKLRSFRTLLLVAPYFSRTEWLTMVAKSTFTFNRLISAFWNGMQLLWLIAPGVYLGLLLIGSQLFNLDPFIMVGRAVAITVLLPILVSGLRELIRTVRNQEALWTKLKRSRNMLLWYIVSIALAVAVWFFASETLSLSSVILILFYDLMVMALCVTVLLHLFDLPRLGDILYSSVSRVMIIVVGSAIARYASLVFLPVVWHAPTNFHTVIYSPVASAISFLGNLLLYSSFGYGIFWLAIGIAVMSVFVHIMTYKRYWSLRSSYVAFTRKGEEKGVKHLVQVAKNRRKWFHLRKKAIEYLRLMDLPLHDIGDLNVILEQEILAKTVYEESWRSRFTSFVGGNLDLRPELERAIHESVERVTEEKREFPDEQYLTMLVNRGKASYQKGSYYEAFTYLNHAITLHGKNAEAFYLRGKMRKHLGQYVEALIDLDQALILNPRDSQVWRLRGETRQRLGQYAEALEDLKQALDLNPQDDWALLLRGTTRMRQGHYLEALEDLKQALDLNPQNSWYHYNRVSCVPLSRPKESVWRGYTRRYSVAARWTEG